MEHAQKKSSIVLSEERNIRPLYDNSPWGASFGGFLHKIGDRESTHRAITGYLKKFANEHGHTLFPSKGFSYWMDTPEKGLNVLILDLQIGVCECGKVNYTAEYRSDVVAWDKIYNDLRQIIETGSLDPIGSLASCGLGYPIVGQIIRKKRRCNYLKKLQSDLL